MIRLFISQPMRDKTDEEIKAEREQAVRVVKDYIPDTEIEVIDSFFESAPHDAAPAWFLGKSIELLSGANAAYFCNGWDQYRGCKIEHTVCREYGIPTFYSPEECAKKEAEENDA